MSKAEFLDNLRRALNGSLDSGKVAENIRYYEEYFTAEESKGRSEAEILTMLGDPRLLARTIIETQGQEGTYEYADAEESCISEDEPEQQTRAKVYRMSGCLPIAAVLLVIALVIMMVVGVVTSILGLLMPLIIPAAIVLLVIHFFQKKL